MLEFPIWAAGRHAGAEAVQPARKHPRRLAGCNSTRATQRRHAENSLVLRSGIYGIWSGSTDDGGNVLLPLLSRSGIGARRNGRRLSASARAVASDGGAWIDDMGRIS